MKKKLQVKNNLFNMLLLLISTQWKRKTLKNNDKTAVCSEYGNTKSSAKDYFLQKDLMTKYDINMIVDQCIYWL